MKFPMSYDIAASLTDVAGIIEEQLALVAAGYGKIMVSCGKIMAKLGAGLVHFFDYGFFMVGIGIIMGIIFDRIKK